MSTVSRELELLRILEEKLIELELPEEGLTGFVLQETGEWDGFPHWMRYYEIVERLGDLSDG